MPTINIPSAGHKDGVVINIDEVERVEAIAITSGSIIYLKNGTSVQTGITPEQVSGMIKDVSL